MTRERGRGRSSVYWSRYSNLQKVKHALIREYLNGWFPKLGYWAGEVLYVETHAGRGRHVSGEPGSPLVALAALRDHTHLDRLLRKSSVRFLLIERDPEEAKSLREEVSALHGLPPGVRPEIVTAAFEDVLTDRLRELQTAQGGLPPTFIFVDPYTFKLPYRTLQRLMHMGRSELFVNVMWREFDMAVGGARKGHQGTAEMLDEMLGGTEWRQQVVGRDARTRAEQTVSLIGRKTGAAWATHALMLSSNRTIRYVLLHLTNHAEGRKLMKSAMWKYCRVGGGRSFVAHKGDDPSQMTLLKEEPDLRQLRTWVIESLSARPKRWQELEEGLLSTIWLDKHLGRALRELRKEGMISMLDERARSSAAADPLLGVSQPQG